MEELPRLRGRGKHRVDYRHIIDWLVRKPGAFENYRYREELFPTSRFRMAWDALRELIPLRANKRYLEMLQLAAQEREARVDDALRSLLEQGEIGEGIQEFAQTQRRRSHPQQSDGRRAPAQNSSFILICTSRGAAALEIRPKFAPLATFAFGWPNWA